MKTKTKMKAGDTVRVSEYATLIKRSTTHVYWLIKKGKIQGTKRNGLALVVLTQSDIDKYYKERKAD